VAMCCSSPASIPDREARRVCAVFKAPTGSCFEMATIISVVALTRASWCCREVWRLNVTRLMWRDSSVSVFRVRGGVVTL